MAYGGAYSGSPALTKMRYGDNVLDFKGFGEMLQCVQLECSKHLRKKHTQELSEILNELMFEFSKEFTSEAAFGKLDAYDGKFEEKIEQEKANMFSINNLGFDDEIASESILLSASLRRELEVQNGDQLKLNGHLFQVAGMKKKYLKEGKTMMLNSKNREIVKEKLHFEK